MSWIVCSIEGVRTNPTEIDGRQIPVVFLTGATAAGKTDLALQLAQRFPMDIVSVDAAQVYRGMDIGTAKPDLETLNAVPHALVNICDPAERYSAGQFRRDAMREINASISRNRIPLLVGGTMFYFRALEEGLSDLPKADAATGREIRERAHLEGWPALHQELMKIDPASAAKISPSDTQRIQRLLEIHIHENQRPSQVMRSSPKAPLRRRLLKIAVSASNRSVLRTRVEQRFKTMLDAGFLEEAHGLFNRADLNASLPAMKTVGYRQAWQFFRGEINRMEMEETIIQATCALAKRQLTWIRNNPGTVWLNSESERTADVLSAYLCRALMWK